jgi:pSer/pThr/pTyr-binding forkhead associated (FHA) protein
VELVLSVRSKADSSVYDSRHPVNGALLLGRGPDCAVLLDGTGISREHAAIQWENSALFVTDLSANGTWVNGKRILGNRKCKLAEGDSIELPGYEIRYRITGTGPEVAGPVPAAAPPDVKPAVPVVAAALQTSQSRAQFSIRQTFTSLELFLILTAVAAFALLVAWFNS